MPSCEVQRTLVKSPPELWAELSDPASLAKHLGEFGEIRTVRVEPETAVAWEAEDVHGVVQLKASGWGTKVTLTAVREHTAEETPAEELEASQLAMPGELAPAASPTAAVLEVETEPGWSEALTEFEPQLQEPLTELDPGMLTVTAPVVVAEPEPAPIVESEPAPERRPGLFARLFRRRRKTQPIFDPEAFEGDEHVPLAEELATFEEPAILDGSTPIAVEETATGEELVTTEDLVTAEELVATEDLVTAQERVTAEGPGLEEAEPESDSATERPDLAAELAGVEQAMVAQDTALLTAVLDRLGAAHHRPFSRG